jgi:hydroxymethylpyrimidine pyrophosphatase-like HAD family hydrolase
MRIFVDVDGTLTSEQRGNSIFKCPLRNDVVEKVRLLARQGHEIIIWSGSTTYAKQVAAILGIPTVACVGKPEMIIDNEKERWSRRLHRRVITPEEFLAHTFASDADIKDQRP